MEGSQYDEWEIKALQTRYKAMDGIELDQDQAPKMLQYEAEKDSGSSKFSFSIWEELDYEEVKFKEILTSTQFDSYISKQADRLKQIKGNLIEVDKQFLPQLNAAQEKLLYYKTTFLPLLHKNLMLLYPALNSEKEKINFLKSAYKQYLADLKKQILVEHFRHSRTFQPTFLQLSLLRYDQLFLFPDYFLFKETLDIPTKTVADFLSEKILRISKDLPGAIKQATDELGKFNESNTAKHLGKISGWHTTVPMNNKTEELIFAFLLAPDPKN